MQGTKQVLLLGSRARRSSQKLPCSSWKTFHNLRITPLGDA
jgi:hypothetical protein